MMSCIEKKANTKQNNFWRLSNPARGAASTPVTGAMQDVHMELGHGKEASRKASGRSPGDPLNFSLKRARKKSDFYPKIKGLLNISPFSCHVCWPPFALGEPPIHTTHNKPKNKG